MRQAIKTRYAGPTDTRGSRVIAQCQAGKLTWHWDYGLNPAANHQAAAQALAAKLGWDGRWIGGANVKGDGFVFVNTVDDDGFTVEAGAQ